MIGNINFRVGQRNQLTSLQSLIWIGGSIAGKAQQCGGSYKFLKLKFVCLYQKTGCGHFFLYQVCPEADFITKKAVKTVKLWKAQL